MDKRSVSEVLWWRLLSARGQEYIKSYGESSHSQEAGMRSALGHMYRRRLSVVRWALMAAYEHARPPCTKVQIMFAPALWALACSLPYEMHHPVLQALSHFQTDVRPDRMSWMLHKLAFSTPSHSVDRRRISNISQESATT